MARKGEKFGDALAEKKVTLSWLMNSNMVKPEKLSLSLFSAFKIQMIFLLCINKLFN